MRAPLLKRMSSAVLTVLALLWVSSSDPTAQRASLKVLASNNVRPVMELLHPDLERQLGASITLTIDTSSALRTRISGGESFDVAVLIPEAVSTLTNSGHLSPGAVEIVRSEIGLAVPKGSVVPLTKTSDDLRAALRNARAIAFLKDGASRAPIGRMLDAFGITVPSQKVTLFGEDTIPESIEVLGADLVILRTNQLDLVRNAVVIRDMPADWQSYVHIQAAIASRTQQRQASEALLRALRTPRAQSLFFVNDQENQ